MCTDNAKNMEKCVKNYIKMILVWYFMAVVSYWLNLLVQDITPSLGDETHYGNTKKLQKSQPARDKIEKLAEMH